jgi:hypothetical protein
MQALVQALVLALVLAPRPGRGMEWPAWRWPLLLQEESFSRCEPVSV